MNFDIVINFDGPQELTHPITKNYPIRDEFIYPKRYSRLVAEMAQSRQCVIKMNQHAKKNTYIPVLELFSLYQIKKCYDYLTLEDYKAHWKKDNIYKDHTEDEIIIKSLEVWKSSSKQIQNFSEQNNFLYLHVIMPNQHLMNSKILSEEELKIISGSEYAPIIEKYYDKFNLENEDIKHVLDLKYIFENTKDTIYRDDCCKFNDTGIKIISNNIADYLNKNKLLN